MAMFIWFIIPDVTQSHDVRTMIQRSDMSMKYDDNKNILSL